MPSFKELDGAHPLVNPNKVPKRDDVDGIYMFRHITDDGFAVTFYWDRRLGRFVLGLRCGHETERPLRLYGFPAAALFQNIDVKPEELRGIAEEMVEAKSWPRLSTDDLITVGMDKIDFTGKSVLDIGGYDGRFAKMALLRGASRAVCLDNQQWTEYGWQKPQPLEGVEYVKGDFRMWSEQFDVVLLLNVLYHLEDPFAALKHLHRITNQELLICTLSVWSDLPVWRPFEPREVNPEDVTVFWGPSPGGLRKALSIAGWQHCEEVGRSHERMVYLAGC